MYIDLLIYIYIYVYIHTFISIRTLTQTFETQSVSQIRIKIASDYTWFPLQRWNKDPRPRPQKFREPALLT